MADREDRPNPLRQPFVEGRAAIEFPGQGATPLTMERESRLTLGAKLADYSDLAPGVDTRGFEYVRWISVAPAAGRHACVRFSHAFGFRVLHLRNMAGVAVMNIFSPHAIAIAPGVGAVSRLLQAQPITNLVVELGDVPPPALASAYLPAAYDVDLAAMGGGLWIPPNQTIAFVAVVAATATDLCLWISAPRP